MNNVKDINKDVLQQVRDAGWNHYQLVIVMLEMIVNRWQDLMDNVRMDHQINVNLGNVKMHLLLIILMKNVKNIWVYV